MAARGNKEDLRPVVRIFEPGGPSAWLLTEVSPTNPKIAFGLCDTGDGNPKLGHVDLSELAYFRSLRGRRLEVDKQFRATKTLSEYAYDARRQGRINA